LDHSALVSLLAELFTAIRLLSGYPAPAAFPDVVALPAIEIQRRLCDGRPCHIKAYYHPDSGVVIDDSLDLRNDPFDRSILLHELVHHMQKTTGKFEDVRDFCVRRVSEEFEAYEIQNRYLSQVNAARRAMVLGWNGKCADEKASAKVTPSQFGTD